MARDFAKEEAFLRKILKGYHIRMRVVLQRNMPKTDREFEDVHYDGHKRILWQSRNGGMEEYEWMESVWHEVGHCIAADWSSRTGINWCEPYPRRIRRKAKRIVSEGERRSLLRHENEGDACDATVAALLVFKADRETWDAVCSYANIGYPYKEQAAPGVDERTLAAPVLRWIPRIERALRRADAAT